MDNVARNERAGIQLGFAGPLPERRFREYDKVSLSPPRYRTQKHDPFVLVVHRSSVARRGIPDLFRGQRPMSLMNVERAPGARYVRSRENVHGTRALWSSIPVGRILTSDV